MIDGETARMSYRIQVSTIALPLVHPNYDGPMADRAVCGVETGSIRLMYDGSPPTADMGHKFNSGDHFTVDGNINVREAMVIRTGSTDAEVQVTLEAR